MIFSIMKVVMNYQKLSKNCGNIRKTPVNKVLNSNKNELEFFYAET